MITHISHTLAQQIVNTIKDVCSYDINFINPSGTIIASTNSARIGTFHEIGRKAAATGVQSKWLNPKILPGHGRESICPFIMRTTFWP